MLILIDSGGVDDTVCARSLFIYAKKKLPILIDSSIQTIVFTQNNQAGDVKRVLEIFTLAKLKMLGMFPDPF